MEAGPLDGIDGEHLDPGRSGASSRADPLRHAGAGVRVDDEELHLWGQAWPASEPWRACRARRNVIASNATAMTAKETPVVAVPSA
jgi:hypothetical protein